MTVRTLAICLIDVALLAAWDAPALARSSVDDSRRNAIVHAIEKAAPAVVSVNVVVRKRPSPSPSKN